VSRMPNRLSGILASAVVCALFGLVAHTAAQQSAVQNAARKCKAERADPNFAATHGGKTFAPVAVLGLGKGQNLFLDAMRVRDRVAPRRERDDAGREPLSAGVGADEGSDDASGALDLGRALLVAVDWSSLSSCQLHPPRCPAIAGTALPPGIVRVRACHSAISSSDSTTRPT